MLNLDLLQPLLPPRYSWHLAEDCSATIFSFVLCQSSVFILLFLVLECNTFAFDVLPTLDTVYSKTPCSTVVPWVSVSKSFLILQDNVKCNVLSPSSCCSPYMMSKGLASSLEFLSVSKLDFMDFVGTDFVIAAKTISLFTLS